MIIDANEIFAARKRWGHQERGKAIRRLRERYGITLEELARKSGVTKQSVSQFELGKTEPRLEREVAITQAMHDAITRRLSQNPDPKGIYKKLSDLA